MRFCRVHVAAVRGGNEDRAARMSSLTNKEPLMVVKACVDIMWEVVQEDCSNGRNSVVGEGKAPLRCSRHRFGFEGLSGAENGDISRDGGVGGHRGSEVFATW